MEGNPTAKKFNSEKSREERKKQKASMEGLTQQ